MSRARRYLSAYIDPKTGRERAGTGPDSQCFHRYVSAANVIRFGLERSAFPAGQYNIYDWPEHGPARLVTVAYKRDLTVERLARANRDRAEHAGVTL